MIAGAELRNPASTRIFQSIIQAEKDNFRSTSFHLPSVLVSKQGKYVAKTRMNVWSPCRTWSRKKSCKNRTQRELRELQARMEAMERNNSENTDTSDEEESYEDEREEVVE